MPAAVRGNTLFSFEVSDLDESRLLQQSHGREFMQGRRVPGRSGFPSCRRGMTTGNTVRMPYVLPVAVGVRHKLKSALKDHRNELIRRERFRA